MQCSVGVGSDFQALLVLLHCRMDRTAADYAQLLAGDPISAWFIYRWTWGAADRDMRNQMVYRIDTLQFRTVIGTCYHVIRDAFL